MRLIGRLAGILAALASAGVVTGGCGSGSGSAGGASSTTATAPRQSAGTAPTLGALTASVQAQITGDGSNDFDVTGLSKLTCDLPSAWTVGATFKCFGSDFADDEIGEYDGTVMPESGGVAQWSGQWSPK